MQPYEVCRQINDAFAANGYAGPVISHIQITQRQNIALITTADFPAKKVLEKEALWKHVLPYEKAEIDQLQFKVIVNGVSTKYYNTEIPMIGLSKIKAELEQFHKDLTMSKEPQWLTPTAKRLLKQKASIILTFRTQAQQKQACRAGFILGGERLSGVEYIDTPKTTQCQRCCGFGHLESFCRNDAACKLCGERHHTKAHHCTICSTTGKTCSHVAPKCSNCRGNHMADSKTCETLAVLKQSIASALEPRI